MKIEKDIQRRVIMATGHEAPAITIRHEDHQLLLFLMEEVVRRFHHSNGVGVVRVLECIFDLGFATGAETTSCVQERVETMREDIAELSYARRMDERIHKRKGDDK